VRCISRQRHIYLLSQPLSSRARQAVMEEPFTSPIAVVNVFYMEYVAMIVVRQIVTVVSLCTYM
jgi:hypothetical protein